MALPEYDPQRHHFGIGVDADTLKGFLTQGTLTKRLASQPFDRASNVGSDELISSERFSVWTQSDYTGGEFFYDWSDEAGFAHCVGMMPNQLGSSLMTTRPIELVEGGHSQDTDQRPFIMDTYDGKLWVLFVNSSNLLKILRYTNLDNSEPDVDDDQIDLPGSRNASAAAFNFNTDRLWVGTTEASTGTAAEKAPRVYTYVWHPDAVRPSRLFTQKTELRGPVVAADPATKVCGIQLFSPLKLIVTRHGTNDDDDRVWAHISGTGDSTKWDLVGVLPGRYVKSCVYQGSVYIMTRSLLDNQTQLSSTQGDMIHPIVNFPYYFRGESMIEYAGRLFVAGVGLDLGGNETHGELYEVSGTSLRLVRTFKPESVIRTPRTQMKHMKALAVAEGVLWMPDANGGTEIYDAVSDGLFGGPELQAGGSVFSTPEFCGAVPFGDSVFFWGQSTSSGYTGLYRTRRWSEAPGEYTCYVETSDFDIHPGRKKIWGECVVHTREIAPTLEASVDSGDTWTEIASTSESEINGHRYETVFDLSTLDSSRSLRLRFTFTHSGTAGEYPAEILSHSVSFLLRNSGLRQWSLTVPAVEQATTWDDTEDQDYDPEEVREQFWDWATEGTILVLQEDNGEQARVVITNLEDRRPAVTIEGESFLSLSLAEVGEPPVAVIPEE